MCFELSNDDIEEYLEECPAVADNKYCTVYISAPDLTPQLLLAISGMIAGAYIPDFVAWTETVPVGRVIQQVSLTLAIMILGSVAQYQLAVWAQPMGSARRNVQATWDDTVHQAEIGAVVPQSFTDPLAYTVADCQTIADFEGLVAQMQRRRVKIEKIAHLQDEDGDTIRVVHPYSGQTMDLFITDIKRKFKKGAEDGYFLDEITGWVVSA
jgi:hypothetical protein